MVYLPADIPHQLLWDDDINATMDEDKNDHPRIKTVAGLIILCLNLDVDPPGIQRHACATSMQGWVETTMLTEGENLAIHSRHEAKRTAMQRIGEAIQQQYASMWHGRAPRLRCLLDPTIDEVLKAASAPIDAFGISMTASESSTSAFSTEPTTKPIHATSNSSTSSRTEILTSKVNPRRREHVFTPKRKINTVDDGGPQPPNETRMDAPRSRLLIHYNGQGMPVITTDGEFWAFNSAFTQYVPIALSRVIPRSTATIWILDSPWSNRLIPALSAIEPSVHGDGQILMLGAGAGYAALHGHPNMPTDVFTAILTTPVRTALHWAVTCSSTATCGSKIPPHYIGEYDSSTGNSSISQIPDHTDRRLAALLAAITDTIAWEVLPVPLFKSLFRKDVVVAGLFRNFLLALRMLSWQGAGGHLGPPCSMPPLPAEAIIHHPLWDLWETVLATEHLGIPFTKPDPPFGTSDAAPRNQPQQYDGASMPVKQDSCMVFFEAQMQEFEIWIEMMQKERTRLLATHLFHSKDKRLLDASTGHSIDPKDMHGGDQRGMFVSFEIPPVVSSPISIKEPPWQVPWPGALSCRLERLLMATSVPPWPPLLHLHGNHDGEAMKCVSRNVKQRRRDPLPMLLQALLLGPASRMRALRLIAAYVQISEQCVREAIAVGLFPLISRLTTALTKGTDSSLDERILLILIWARLVKVSPALLADENIFLALTKFPHNTDATTRRCSNGNGNSEFSKFSIAQKLNLPLEYSPMDALAWLLMMGMAQLCLLRPPFCLCRYSTMKSTDVSIYGLIWLLSATALAALHCEYCGKTRAAEHLLEITRKFKILSDTDENRTLFVIVCALSSVLGMALEPPPETDIAEGAPSGTLLALAYGSDTLGLQQLLQTRSIWTLIGIAADLFFEPRHGILSCKPQGTKD